MQCPLVFASTGAIARYPMGRKPSFATQLNTFADFSTQSFSVLNNPLSSWALNLAMLRDDEAQDWFEFIESVKGQGTLFTFADPWDNLLTYTEEFENAAWVKGSSAFIGKNYLLWSEDFSQAAWTKTNTGGAANPVITTNVSSPLAPDGTQTADQIAFPTTTGSQTSVLAQTITPPSLSSQVFVFSVFLRASASVNVQLEIRDQTGASLGSANVGLNNTSWQRLAVQCNSGAATSLTVAIYQPASHSASTVFAVGGQLEYSSGFSTSFSDYTKTTSAATELLIADPFWLAAPSNFPGSSLGLNSAFLKRGRQLVIPSTTAPTIDQGIAIAPGGAGNYRNSGLDAVFSLYIKRQAASPPNCTIQVGDDPGFNETNAQTFTPTTSWVRCSAATSFSGSNSGAAMRARITASAAGTFYIFGAQVDMDLAISRYKHNIATGGVHPNCRIPDLANHSVDGFDLNTLQEVVIQEYAG